MKCKELENELEMLCQTGHKDDSVVILLSEKSIGAHASAQVQNAYAGFDFDSGTILLLPDKRLVSDFNSRDVPKNKVMWRNALVCPTCEHMIKKKSNYCDNCGQRLSDIIKVIE